jgi:cell division protein FtsI/penicillin-binding protein 2
MINAPTIPIQAPDIKKDREFRGRFLILKLFFALFFVAVGARLVLIQVIEAPTYKKLARKQYESKFVLPATRGKILDREGNVLVSNTMFQSFSADPRFIGDDAEDVAEIGRAHV